MADKKISQLTALAAANLAPSTDVLAIVDTSATETKKIVAQDLINGVLNVASAVGIGTASPGYKLDATASAATVANFNRTTSSGSTVAVQVAGSTVGTLGSDTGGNGRFDISSVTGGASANTIQFSRSGGTLSMLLDSSGNLGLGVTPSAWGTLKGLQVGNASVAGFSNFAYLNSNAFYDGTNWKYIATGFAAKYDQVNSVHAWYTAPSGTINTAISFTQAMTLDAAGALLVGITSRPNDARIASSGPIYVDSAPYGIGNFAVGSYAATSVFANSGYASSAISFGRYNGSGTYTSQVLIDPNGNLGVGTTSPETTLHLNKATAGGAGPYLMLDNSSSSTLDSSAGISFALDSGASFSGYSARIEGVNTNAGNGASSITFSTWNGSARGERARITSGGDFLVGTTATGLQTVRSMGFQVNAGCTQFISHSTADGNGDSYVEFGYNGTKIGSITQNGTTAVAYNTTSDYRLKTFISSVTGAGARLDALKPVEYEWKADGKRARGFFAHEFQQVYADSVTGEKDAVDAVGKPVYQAMQASTTEVIADLVAEIQSLRSRVSALEAK